METPTEEFVRRHRFLIEQTRDDPNDLTTALDGCPELPVCMLRLDAIARATGPLTAGAHDKFRRKLEDYRGRWAHLYDAVADRVRSLIYRQAAQRVMEEFLNRYHCLIEWTADNPRAIVDLGVRQPSAAYAFGVLDTVHGSFSNRHTKQQNNAKERRLLRFLAGSPKQFQQAMEDFDCRWRASFAQLVEKFSELDCFLDRTPRNYPDEPGLPGQPPFDRQNLTLHLGVPPPSREQTQALKNWKASLEAYAHGRDWLGSLLFILPDEPPEAPDEYRPFDPGRDSAADAIDFAAKFVGDNRYGDFKFDVREALNWIFEQGIDLAKIEGRAKGFPAIVVPKSVSDQYDLGSPRGLHAALRQIWLAYIIGADLAAIALCRAVTERLIRFHYAHDIPNAKDSKIKHRPGNVALIYQLQQKEEFAFLRKFNLPDKMKQANEILHQDDAREEIPNPDRDRCLVTDWLRVLGEMIDSAA